MKFSDNSLTTIVIITRDRWKSIPRIRQQIARQLTRFYNVVYVEKHVGFIGYNKIDTLEKINDRLIVFSPALPLPIPTRLYLFDPITHFIANIYIKNKINKYLKLTKLESAILFNFEFDFPEIYSSNLFQHKIYFCNDDFPNNIAAPLGKIKRYYLSSLLHCYEKKVAESATICFAVSYSLVSKLKKYNSTVELYLPGHEFKARSVSKAIKNDEEPIKICFMGYVDGRLNKSWLHAILGKCNFKLYLIGPNEHFDKKEFSNYDNIVFVDALSGDALLDKLVNMDVLIMPYDTAQKTFMDSISAPNKLFQYLAAGKPIVTSVMPNFIKLPDGVRYQAVDANDFVDKLILAANEDTDKLIKTRLAIANDNTWGKKGDALYAYIESFLTDRNNG